MVISLLRFCLYQQARRARRQAADMVAANHSLDEQAAQVGLLNKEIQHRVKNNLHMVFCLLQVPEPRTDNEEVVEQLQAARLRGSLSYVLGQLMPPARREQLLRVNRRAALSVAAITGFDLEWVYCGPERFESGGQVQEQLRALGRVGNP